jgi:hypothetical protein
VIGVCVLLTIATPSAAVDEFAPVVTSYARCVQEYRTRRNDYATYCRARFPLTVQEAAARSSTRMAALTAASAAAPAPTATAPPPAATTPAPTTVPAPPSPTSSQAPPATSAPPSRTRPRESVDITPAVNKLIKAWAARPRTPKPPPASPADPLAVIPQIQAVCAAYAGNAERWRRCTTDAWNRAGLRGQPPLVLQVPPAPPPVERPPIAYEPTGQAPVKPPLVKPEAPILAPPDPPAESAPPPPVKSEAPSKPAPPTPRLVEPPLPPQPASPSVPLWAWLLAAIVALVAAGAGGFGLSRWLSKARASTPRAPQAAAVRAPPEIILIADLGMVVLTPDGPPRAGMAVSMRFALDAGEREARLDYPTLETAP